MITTNTNKGFTFIELLISMVVIVAISGGLLSFQYVLGQNQTLIFNTYKNEDEAASVIASFVKELRTAKTSDTGSFPIEMAQDNEIRFYSDIDSDNQTEKVRYYLSGTNLLKGVTEPTAYPITYPPASEISTVVASDVRNNGTPVFYYYNKNWPTDTSNNPLILSQRLSNTKLVRIYLRINKNANSDKDFIIESETQIRMLKDNL